MSDSKRQSFCSYLCCWSDHGNDRTNFDALATNLPSKGKTCYTSEFSGGRFYLSLPDRGPLHQWKFWFDGNTVLFVQGDFYEVADLESLADQCLDASQVNLTKLAVGLNELNGVFSGFVLDVRTGDFHTFADRYGFARVFASRHATATLISSSLWPLREHESGRGSANVEAVQDTLMFGFPLLGDTVYSNIHLPRPGTILSNDASGERTTRYFDFQRKPRSRPIRQIVDEFKEISQSHTQSMLNADPDFQPAVALSGGKDSRVALIGLLESGVRPECIAGYSGSKCWDSERGENVGLTAGCSTHLIDYSEQLEGDFEDSNVLIDGGRTGLWTMNLARHATQLGCTTTYFGTTGDVLSGGWSANPKKFASVDALCDFTLRDYIEYDSPAEQFADMFVGRTHADIRTRFRSGYIDELCDDISNAELAFRIMTRNFRRIRTFMSGSVLYSTPIHFFHDTRISDFYWSLPFHQLVNQRTHSALCSIHAGLGRIPATSFPFGVRYEPTLVPIMKLLMPEQVKDGLRRLVRGKPAAVERRDVDAAELQSLLEKASALGIDTDRLRTFVETESNPRLVEQRLNIINTQLDPTELLSRSRLIGPKQFEPLPS